MSCPCHKCGQSAPTHPVVHVGSGMFLCGFCLTDAVDNARGAIVNGTFVNLAELPPVHPLRNVPLGPMGAVVRNAHSKIWNSVARWAISGATYNQLSGPWIDPACNEWRIWRPKRFE